MGKSFRKVRKRHIIGANLKTCIFCHRNHSLTRCDIVIDPKVRKQIIINDKQSFVCLRLGNSAKAFQKNWKCFKCSGPNITSICTFIPKASSYRSEQKYFPEDTNNSNQLQRNFKSNFRGDDSSTSSLMLLFQNSVLLQTAIAKVPSADERYSGNLHILIYSRSRLSFISPKAREALKHKQKSVFKCK